jgi:hypothetical protein
MGELTLLSRNTAFSISRYRLLRRSVLENCALVATSKLWAEVYENTAQSDACALQAGYCLAYTADALAFFDAASLRRSSHETLANLARASWQRAHVTYKNTPLGWKRHSFIIVDNFARIFFFSTRALLNKMRGNTDGYFMNLGSAACALGVLGGAMVVLPQKIWRRICRRTSCPRL